MIFEVKIPEEKIKEIDEKLQEIQKKTPNEIKKVVNASAKKAKKELAMGVQKRYASKTYNAQYVRGQVSIKNATVGKVEATLEAKGEATELREFKVSSLTPGEKKTIKGKVLKKGRMESLFGAFVVRFKNGHVSVVERVHGKYMRNAKKRNKHWEKLEKKLSPAVPQMIGQVHTEKVFDLQEMLNQKLEAHIEKIMGGK